MVPKHWMGHDTPGSSQCSQSGSNNVSHCSPGFSEKGAKVHSPHGQQQPSVSSNLEVFIQWTNGTFSARTFSL